MHFMLVMVIFRIREDFGLSFSFLVDGFSMFYDASETGTEKLVLGVAMFVLCSFKNYVIEGKWVGVLPTTQRLPKYLHELKGEDHCRQQTNLDVLL